MRKFTVLWFLGVFQLASSSGAGSAKAGVEVDQVTPICSFPKIAATSVGVTLRVRGKMTLHAHGIFLSDKRCPDVRVHLKGTAGGPNISLCDQPELVQKFGCPAGGSDAGPIVTAVGVLRSISEPDNGLLLVEQLLDFEKAHDAERL